MPRVSHLYSNPMKMVNKCKNDLILNDRTFSNWVFELIQRFFFSSKARVYMILNHTECSITLNTDSNGILTHRESCSLLTHWIESIWIIWFMIKPDEFDDWIRMNQWFIQNHIQHLINQSIIQYWIVSHIESMIRLIFGWNDTLRLQKCVFAFACMVLVCLFKEPLVPWSLKGF